MNLYEFLSSLGFCQWLGVLTLAFIATLAVDCAFVGLAGLFSRRPK